MEIERIKVTPHKAEEWLRSVPEFQRKINESLVERLVIAITRGEWRENGATIVFNNRGELIDGQHRLTAIARSGIPVWMVVITRVSPGEETFQTIDDGKSRKITDFIRCANANVTSAVLLMYWRVVNGFFPDHNVPAPHADVIKTGKEYIEYISGLVQPCYMAGRITGHTSFLTFLVFYHTKIYPVDPNLISNFVGRVADGVELRVSEPAYQLRKRFLNVAKAGELKRMTAHAMILKAFNYAVDGKPINLIKWDQDVEEFPPLRGYQKGVGLVKDVDTAVRRSRAKEATPEAEA